MIKACLGEKRSEKITPSHDFDYDKWKWTVSNCSLTGSWDNTF
jgi:hypothetical protein